MGLIGQRWDNFNLEVENTKLRLKEKIFAQSSGSYDRVIEYWPKGLSVIVMTSILDKFMSRLLLLPGGVRWRSGSTFAVFSWLMN